MFNYQAITILLFLIFSNNTYAEISAHVLSYGTYKSKGHASLEVQSSAATGYTTSYDDYILVNETRNILGIRCTSFGFAYRIVGLPDIKTDLIEITAHHPLMNNYLGIKSKSSTAVWDIFPMDGSYEDVLIYTMRKPYEVLPGKWILEIKYKGKLLASESFIVSEEKKGAQPNKQLECDVR